MPSSPLVRRCRLDRAQDSCIQEEKTRQKEHRTARRSVSTTLIRTMIRMHSFVSNFSSTTKTSASASVLAEVAVPPPPWGRPSGCRRNVIYTSTPDLARLAPAHTEPASIGSKIARHASLAPARSRRGRQGRQGLLPVRKLLHRHHHHAVNPPILPSLPL